MYINQKNNYDNIVGKIYFRFIGIIFLLSSFSSLAAGLVITSKFGALYFGIVFFLVSAFCFYFFIWCINPKRKISDADYST